MAYIQITTRCNMTCAHCCYSCGAIGEDMSMETFRKALQLGGGYVTIGGGEPTVHPKFTQMLCEAIAECDEGGVFIITNGKKTKLAIMLAKMAKSGVIGAQLSRDQYHDPIDYGVVREFESGTGLIRDTSDGGRREPLPHGRGLEVLGYEEDDEQPQRDYKDCPCPSIVVDPKGNIKACGCDDAPIIGHVDNLPEGCDKEWDCCKDPTFYDWAEENSVMVCV